MIEFSECGNYRGYLQAKAEGGKFFWRVDCDLDEPPWQEIPEALYLALMAHHESPDRDGERGCYFEGGSAIKETS